MNVKDIIALANAGFSAEQIAGLQAAEAAAPAPAPADPQPAPAPAPADPQPASAPAPADPQPTPDPVAAMLQRIGVALDNLQAANIRSSEQPHELTADEVLAQVINPPRVVK
jgi:hypothetical protein